MNHFEFKGYAGSAEVDTESMVLVGKLQGITDTITYSAADISGLEAAFKEAVEDYLTTCAELGHQPDAPFKGSFNVRIGATLHRSAAMKARQQGLTLNEFVSQSIAVACAPKMQQHHTHCASAATA